MKKRNLQSLKLNKKFISNFKTEEVLGGKTGSLCWISKNDGGCPK
jgi:hypothetical protein